MPAAGVDRPLSERRIGVYKRMLAEGRFRPVTWAKVFCKDIGETFRVNGKHTSNLLASHDPPAGCDVSVFVEEYEADTVEDVVDLYSTFDSAAQTRNATDINRQFASVIPELAGFDVATINLYVGALNYEPEKKTNSRTTTTTDRAEKLFDNVAVCVWLHGIIGAAGGRGKVSHIQRVPVVAAMLATYAKAQKAATEFWTAVRDETGPVPTCPDRVLAKWLVTTRLKNSASGTVPQRYILTPREFYFRSVSAWNAWRKGETTTLKYSPSYAIPAAR